MLRRHVGNGAESGACLGQFAHARHARQAEIENAYPTGLVDDDILRLDVAVDDACLMRGTEAFADLNYNVQDLVDWQGRPAGCFYNIPQRFAFDIFHGDEGTAFVLADFVYGDDVGVVQCSGRFGFAAKTLVEISIGDIVLWQEFERDFAGEGDIFGKVDFTHAAFANFFEDAVMEYVVTNHA